jgi:hypothetical protein
MNDVTVGDLTQAVREAAMLASVSISVWEASKTDAGLLAEVKQRHGATGDVGRVIKNMMAGVDAPLKAVHSAFFAVRSKHYEMTLPWVADPHAPRQRGPRLLPNMLFQNYSMEVTTLRRAAMAQLDAFLAEYPTLVTKAQANLGGMADSVYPSADRIKQLFRIHFDFEPIPAGAAFKGLDDHMLERLSLGLQKKQQRQITDALGAMWAQARDRLAHLFDRLGFNDKGEPIEFKEATVDNVRELLTLLPAWNLTGDPRVSEVTAKIKELLDGVDAKALRKNMALRADVRAKVKTVIDRMTEWGV